jgi:hypothetical protein
MLDQDLADDVEEDVGVVDHQDASHGRSTGIQLGRQVQSGDMLPESGPGGRSKRPGRIPVSGRPVA